MTTPPAGCPRCGAPLTGQPACGACGLRLTGPGAARLWQVDLQLAALTSERVLLLESLAHAGPPQEGEASRRSAQDLLLVLGGVTLALAAAVFAAVTYATLGVLGKALVMGALTALAAAAAPVAARRRLGSTAEVFAGLALALAALDVWAAHRVDLLGAAAVPFDLWVAGWSLVLAALATVYALVVPTWAARTGALVLAHVPVPVLLAHRVDEPGTAAAVLSVVALLDVAALTWLRTAVRPQLSAAALLNGSFGLALALAADAEGALTAALAYALLAAACALTAVPLAAVLLSAAAVQAGAGAVGTPGLRVAAVGLVALAAAAAATRRPRLHDGATAAVVATAVAGLAAAQEDLALVGLGLLAGAAAAALLAGRPGGTPPARVALTAAAAVGLAAGAAAAFAPPGTPRCTAVAAVGLAAAALAAVLPRAPQAGAAAAGGLAVLAAVWGLLRLHGVDTPEAYTLPAAVLALLAGRHARPALDSVRAYAPGLALAFAPTLLLAAGQPSAHTGRLLLVVPAAVAVLVTGASLRLRGPMLGGAAALLAAALLLLAPVADALPRWLTLGLAGGLLLGLGATYESRRRDLDLVRERLARLG